MELGGNIELVGFADEDGGDLIVVKKIVGTFVKRVSTRHDSFESLRITQKDVHGGSVYELHGRLHINGKEYDASSEERNQFFALDALLKKLEGQLR